MAMTLDPNAGPERPAQAAEALASVGLAVVPIAPGKHYPAGLNKWQDQATTDIDTIRTWYQGHYKDYGVGVATGALSGVWAIDIDVKDGKPGAESLRALVDTYGPLPTTVTTITGSGGRHLYFTWDPDRPVQNFQESAGTTTYPLGPGIDIRGTAGQVVAPPTIHPSGRAYAWEPGRDPWSLQPADAPDWVYDLLDHYYNDAPASIPLPDPPPALPPAAAGHPDSIAEHINRTNDWHSVLTTDGWTLTNHRHNESRWTRPGKHPRDGHSAVLHEPDGPLVIFTTEIPPELARAGRPTKNGSGISVSLFGYLAGTRHGGNRSALARTARQELTATQGPPPGPLALPGPAGTPEAHTAAPAGFVDLGDWWDRDEPDKTAEVLTRTDGRGLIYLDELNWIHGDSGSGKTWVLLFAMVQLINAGHHVGWIHYEDPTPATIIRRLKLLGVDRARAVDLFRYYDPNGEPLDAAHLIELGHLYDLDHYGLDSVGEALNAQALNEDSDAEVGPWINHGPRAIVNAGIGVTVLDHGTKAQDVRSKLYPSGSKRKRAAVTGAALLVEPSVAPTAATDGVMYLVCAKDRHGNHGQGNKVGIAHLRHNVEGGIDFHIDPPAPPTAAIPSGDDVAPVDELEAAVVATVAKYPGASKNELMSYLPMIHGASGRQARLDAIGRVIDKRLVETRPGANRSIRIYPIDYDYGADP